MLNALSYIFDKKPRDTDKNKIKKQIKKSERRSEKKKRMKIMLRIVSYKEEQQITKSSNF